MALTELRKTRILSRDFGFVTITRNFQADWADVSEAEDGWTVTGLPVEEDSYPSGTFVLTPMLMGIEVDPRAIPGKALVKAVYRARIPFKEVSA